MSQDRTIFRLGDIIDAIDKIESLLQGKSFDKLQNDPISKAAFERFIEILSEASRHIPPELKESAPEVPWRRVGDIGNHIRHAYDRVDALILWRIYEDGDLFTLRGVISKFIEEIRNK